MTQLASTVHYISSTSFVCGQSREEEFWLTKCGDRVPYNAALYDIRDAPLMKVNCTACVLLKFAEGVYG